MNQGLLAIRPPAAPFDPALLVWWGLGIILLLLVTFVLWRRYGNAWRTRLALYACQRALLAGRLAPRPAADRLEQVLRSGLQGVRPGDCDHLRFTPEYDRQRWYGFVARLETARFSRASLAADDVHSLVREARFWLRRIP